MVDAFQIFGAQALPVVGSALSFTVGTAAGTVNAKKMAIKEIHLCNIDTANPYLFYMRVTRSGGAAVLTYDAESVDPLKTADFYRSVILMPGDKVEFYADTGSKLNIEVSGIIWT